MSKDCYIVGAGYFEGNSFHPKEEDYIIAADGGYLYLKEIGIQPGLLVGDFDSLPEIPKDIEIIRHPEMKDDTDMLLALKKGLEAGYKTFYLFGGSGGRFDHTIANIQLLSFLNKQKATGFIVAENMMITMITDSDLEFSEKEQGIISVFCYGNHAKGVSISGLKYPLEKVDLTNAYPIGVSNEFIGRKSKISVQKGSLIIMWEILRNKSEKK